MRTFNITPEAVYIYINDERTAVPSCSDHYHDAIMLCVEDDLESAVELVRPKLDSNDLANWNGSPIYYLTKELAISQVEKSRGFWKFHDFGIAARCGRRYATVPTGFGPTAPEGYEWACVSIED